MSARGGDGVHKPLGFGSEQYSLLAQVLKPNSLLLKLGEAPLKFLLEAD
jgi:hypothetical protein